MSETPPEGWPAYWKAKVATDLAEAQAAHARICSGLDGALLKVAQHHHPIPGTKALLCAGCDFEWEDAGFDWPCPTWALIVDTPPAPDRAVTGDCGHASPSNGRVCGINSHCTLPFGHQGWHRDDRNEARWGKPWTDDTPPAPDRDALWGLIAELRSRMLGEPNGPAKMRGIEAIERALDTSPAPDPAEALALLGELMANEDRGLKQDYWSRRRELMERARALVEEQGRMGR